MFLNLVIDGRPGIEKEAGWKPGNMGNAGAGGACLWKTVLRRQGLLRLRKVTYTVLPPPLLSPSISFSMLD